MGEHSSQLQYEDDLSLSHVYMQAAAAPATSASAPAASTSREMMQVVDGKFTDFRWKSGAWDLESDAFKRDGKTNWDLVRRSATYLCILPQQCSPQTA